MKNQNILFLRKLAKEIIEMKISDSMKRNYENFYKILRKYGIKRYEKSEDGIGMIGNNFEWTICHILFESQVNSQFVWDDLFKDIPKDLECYK